MSEHKASVRWKRASAGFGYEEYNREHDWLFDSGAKVDASAAPEYKGKADYIDPEEALVAALSSCHMLTFLAIAARKRIVVDSYEDNAVGFLEKNREGKLAVTRAVLRPRIRFSGPAPSKEDLERLHQQAHENCFIANSVQTKITIDA